MKKHVLGGMVGALIFVLAAPSVAAQEVTRLHGGWGDFADCGVEETRLARLVRPMLGDACAGAFVWTPKPPRQREFRRIGRNRVTVLGERLTLDIRPLRATLKLSW